MTVAELIRSATMAGVEISIGVDGKLKLRAELEPPPSLVAELVGHKTDILTILRAEKVSTSPSYTWLHLVVLVDGSVIQSASSLTTAAIKQSASQRYGDNLLAVKAVNGFERFLTEPEIIQALAGTLNAPVTQPPSAAWLARVARLVGTRPSALLESQHLEQHDLIELAGVDASLVADSIRATQTWSLRQLPIEEQCVQDSQKENAPQHHIETAISRSPEWLVARDNFHRHLLECCACHAPISRYCKTGTKLRQQYEETPTTSDKTFEVSDETRTTD